MTEKIAAKLSYDGNADLHRVYLYNDATVPTRSAANMQSYLDRLQLLMSLKVGE